MLLRICTADPYVSLFVPVAMIVFDSVSLICMFLKTLVNGACKYFSFNVFRATTVRYKGRNLRIKAPMCRALKKLCDPDGK